MATIHYLTAPPEQGILDQEYSRLVTSLWQDEALNIQFICHESHFYKLTEENGMAALRVSNANDISKLEAKWTRFSPSWLFYLSNLFSSDIYFVLNKSWYDQSKNIFDPLINTISASIGRENGEIIALFKLGSYKHYDPGTGGGTPSAGAKVP